MMTANLNGNIIISNHNTLTNKMIMQINWFYADHTVALTLLLLRFIRYVYITLVVES